MGQTLRSLLRLPALPPGDLLHDVTIGASSPQSSLRTGAQITMLTFSLTSDRAQRDMNADGLLMAARSCLLFLLSSAGGIGSTACLKAAGLSIGESVFALALSPRYRSAAWTVLSDDGSIDRIRSSIEAVTLRDSPATARSIMPARMLDAGAVHWAAGSCCITWRAWCGFWSLRVNWA